MLISYLLLFVQTDPVPRQSSDSNTASTSSTAASTAVAVASSAGDWAGWAIGALSTRIVGTTAEAKSSEPPVVSTEINTQQAGRISSALLSKSSSNTSIVNAFATDTVSTEGDGWGDEDVPWENVRPRAFPSPPPPPPTPYPLLFRY